MPLSSGIVLVEQRDAGAAAAEQRREGLLEVGVDGGERVAEARVRGLVDALDGFVGLRDRVDQVLALRGQEGVALIELGELLDGHHVDRAELVDLRAQLGDGFFGGHPTRRSAPALSIDGVASAAASDTADGPACSSSSSGSGASAARMAATSGSMMPVRLHLLDLGAHVVERQVDRVEALLREVRPGRLRRSRA